MKFSSDPRTPNTLTAALLFLLFVSGSALAQISPRRQAAARTQHAPALTARTQIVAVPVTVTDRDGNFVPGLSVNDFEVLDNGQPQTISFFEQQDTPVTVGLLIDHSGSMGPKLPSVAAAISAFARSGNPRDQMFFVEFGDSVSTALFDGKSFTNNPAEVEHAISSVYARGRTALYDAVAAGITHARLGRWNKRALVIVSDGGDNASRRTFNQVLEMARGSHAVIYAVGLLSESGQEENPGVLRRLCRETGGIAFFPGPHDSIAKITNEIARDLRGQYMLGIVPSPSSHPGAFHKLTVRALAKSHGKLHVRSRAGYTQVHDAVPSQSPAGASSAEPESASP